MLSVFIAVSSVYFKQLSMLDVAWYVMHRVLDLRFRCWKFDVISPQSSLEWCLYLRHHRTLDPVGIIFWFFISKTSESTFLNYQQFSELCIFLSFGVNPHIRLIVIGSVLFNCTSRSTVIGDISLPYVRHHCRQGWLFHRVSLPSIMQHKINLTMLSMDKLSDLSSLLQVMWAIEPAVC